MKRALLSAHLVQAMRCKFFSPSRINHPAHASEDPDASKYTSPLEDVVATDATEAAAVIAKPPNTVHPKYAAVDFLGPSGQAAADWADAHASEDPDVSKRTAINMAVSTGIRERKGVYETGRLIRRALPGLSVKEARNIAQIEMNSAFGEAALSKMQRIGVQYKQIILAPDACEICKQNRAAGPILTGDSFPSGHMRPPFCDACRCAVCPARGPEEQ